VRAAVATLDAVDRQACEALAEGRSVDEIAGLLGCGWHTAARRISRIREHFKRIGLDGWLYG
jgi:transposase-like protein